MDALQEVSLRVREYVMVLLVGYIVAWVIRKARNLLPLPPGPIGFPIVGNIFDIPRDKAWLTYMEWAKERSE